MGALSGTSKAVFRAPFRDSLLPFTHVPPNDIAALTAVSTTGHLLAEQKHVTSSAHAKSTISLPHLTAPHYLSSPTIPLFSPQVFEASEFTGNAIAGLIMEPVLGEGGIHVLTPEYLWAARALCDRYGAKLIFDEVQSGMGRCGGPGLWACQAAGVAPDIMVGCSRRGAIQRWCKRMPVPFAVFRLPARLSHLTPFLPRSFADSSLRAQAIGKAFGGGVMGAGAVVATRPVWQKFIDEPFLTTTTFGGNPLSMVRASP